MNTDRRDLARRFRELSDDELVSLCASGDLSELAQSVALEELDSRGINPPPARPGAAFAGAEYEGDFVTVAQFLNPTDAHIVRGLLGSAGILAVVGDANLAQMHNLLAVAIGGVRVRVPAARAAEAKEVIAAYNRGDFALPDDGEVME